MTGSPRRTLGPYGPRDDGPRVTARSPVPVPAGWTGPAARTATSG